MSEDILKKVKKLLALASSCNEHEAKSAAAKAQALMVRHNLSMQSLGKLSDYINEGTGDGMSKISRESSYIMSILTQHFFVRCYYDNQFVGYTRTGKRRYVKTPRIVGTAENVTVAQYVYEFLSATYARLWKEYAKEHGNKSMTARNSFAYGLTEGIKITLRESEKAVCTEMGLVIVPDEKLKAFMKQTLNLKSRAVRTANHDTHAAGHGLEAGKKVRISRAIESESSDSGRLLA